MLTAESPHLSGVDTAVRHGLGYALLAAGSAGLRRITHGPLAGMIDTPLWLPDTDEHRDLVEPLRGALGRAAALYAVPDAA